MDEQQLAAIKERFSRTTPGDWSFDEQLTALSSVLPKKRPATVLEARNDWGADDQSLEISDEDAEFIAHAHQDIPALLAYIEELKSDYESLEGEYHDFKMEV